jgi:hypothetical protein
MSRRVTRKRKRTGKISRSKRREKGGGENEKKK